jgi:hypothetical protein
MTHEWPELIPMPAFDHRECDPVALNGCSRCGPLPSTTCCDLCNPDVFSHLLMDTPPATKSAVERKSRINTFERTSTDVTLSKALHDFRCTQARLRFSASNVITCGPSMFMTDSVRKRIVGLAHHLRITSVDAVKQHLDPVWRADFCEEYAQDIFDLVTKYYPLPDPVDPLTEPSITHADAHANPVRRSVTCGACGGAGHISE